jgi:hypothetical protein
VAASDLVIQQTDQDASLSRLSTVQLGYLHDPFASLLLFQDEQQASAGGLAERRFPIINRGSFCSHYPPLSIFIVLPHALSTFSFLSHVICHVRDLALSFVGPSFSLYFS